MRRPIGNSGPTCSGHGMGMLTLSSFMLLQMDAKIETTLLLCDTMAGTMVIPGISEACSRIVCNNSLGAGGFPDTHVDLAFLEVQFSLEEVRNAVFDLGVIRHRARMVF